MSMGEGGKGGGRDFDQELREIEAAKVSMGEQLKKPRTSASWVKLINGLMDEEIYFGISQSGGDENKLLTYEEFCELATDTTVVLNQGSSEIGKSRAIASHCIRTDIKQAEKKK